MTPSSSYNHHRILPLVGSALILFLAQTLLASGGCWTNGVDAFAIPIVTNNGCRNIGHTHANKRNPLSTSASDILESNTETNSEKKKLVLVLGGSGFIGRRVCKELVEASSGDDETATRVVSISRNGKPPSWCFDDNGDSSSSVWAENVEWIKHDIGSASGEEGGGESLAETLGSIFQATTTNESNENEASSSPWETTIVGCIGNVNPTPSWEGLWGLAFDDHRLLEENGKVYDLFLNETNSLRERDNNLLNLQRCVFLSIDYTCQKCLEGPIEGYVDGKRLAEHRFLEAVSNGSGGSSSDDPSNLEKVIVVGLPNFVFGGKRFPGFGKFYRKLVESPPARAYKGGNEALRSLSVAAPEDWVEEMLFSSPVDVEFVGKATAMAARGLVSRDLVNNGEPRKQGFFNQSGLPVEYDDILFVDGTLEIEKLVGVLGKGDLGGKARGTKPRTKAPKSSSSSSTPEPLWEGALIGKRPWLYPVPVTSFFVYLFWGIVTQQFVQTATGM